MRRGVNKKHTRAQSLILLFLILSRNPVCRKYSIRKEGSCTDHLGRVEISEPSHASWVRYFVHGIICQPTRRNIVKLVGVVVVVWLHSNTSKLKIRGANHQREVMFLLIP